MKKVLSYILISFVIFANLFAPILAQAVGDTNIGAEGQKIVDTVADPNKKIQPVVGTADFEMKASTEANDTSVKLIVNINNKSSILQTADFGTIFDLILDINITDMAGKSIDGVTGLIDNQDRTNPFTQRFDKNFNQDAYTKIHEGKPIEYAFKGLNPETKYQIVMNLKESTFISGVGTSTPNIIATSTAQFVTNSKLVTTFVKQESTANINIQTPAKKMPACSFLYIGEGTPMGCIAQGFYYVLFQPTSYLFALAGTFFDYTFSYSVQDSSYRSAFVVQGWGLVRDFCNIFFIFVMLYIAISTILSLHGFKTKETIINVIIIGLFINFSLFATQVIIDASNITARVFYNSDAIKITEKGANSVTENTTKIGEGGVIPLSSAIVNKVNPQNMIIRSGQINNIKDKSGNFSNQTETESAANMDAGTFILIVIMASAINIVGLTVFFTIGFLFVARVIGLWLAMIMAPLAFFTYILPQMEGIKTIGWKNWWPETLKLAFLAPVFIFFMYLILKFLSLDLISETMNKTWAGDGVGFFVATIIPFVFIMILMLKAKNIAVGMSGEFGEMATKLGSSVGGMVLGGAVGAGAVVMRGTVGRLGNSIINSSSIQERAAKKGFQGMVARGLFSGGKKASTASFDARNTKLGGMATKNLGVDMGKAKEGGFTKLRADKTAEREKRAKDLELTADSELKRELMKKKVALKQLEDIKSHNIHPIDGKIEAQRRKITDLNNAIMAEDDPIEKSKLAKSSKEASAELAKLNADKVNITNGGLVMKTDHDGNIIRDANGNATPDGSGKYHTTNGKISMSEVKKTSESSVEAEKTKIEAEKMANEIKANINSDPNLIAANNKKSKADNELKIAENALATFKSNKSYIIGSGSDAALVAAVNNAKTEVTQAESEIKTASDEYNAKITNAEKSLKTAEDRAVEASNIAAAALAASASGTGKSIFELKVKDIPHDEYEINKRNNAVRGDLADLVGSRWNQAANFLSSGGQHSFAGDNEAEYNIRMGKNDSNSSSGHGGGSSSHAAPVSHAKPKPPAGGGGNTPPPATHH